MICGIKYITEPTVHLNFIESSCSNYIATHSYLSIAVWGPGLPCLADLTSVADLW